MPAPRSQADAVEQLLAECLERDEAAWPGAIDAACREHPELAQQLRARWSQLVAFGVAAVEPVLPHERSFGGHRLEAVLGRGATATVYRAVESDSGRLVALKVLRSGLAAAGRWQERFAREVRLASGLEHPGLCRVFGSGAVDGELFFSMELVDGRTLAAEIAAATPPERTLRALVQIARALGHAHRNGLVHRDVKPANVLVRADGSAVLTDLGLAFALDEGHGLTATETVVGSPAYLAPELVAGDGRGSVASDVWALGCCLFECVAGRRAFEAPTRAALFAQILAGERRAMRGDRSLQLVVDTAMARRPGDRYASADAFADDLQRCLDGRSPLAQRPALPRRVVQWVRRNRAVTATMAALLAGAAIAAGGMYRSERANDALRTMALRSAAGDALGDTAELAVLLAAAAHTAEAGAASRSLLYEALSAWHPWHEAREPATTQVAAPAPRLVSRDGRTTWLRGEGAVPLAGANEAPLAVAAAPDERMLACGSADGVVRLWTARGEAFATISTPCAVHALGFSADAARLAIGGGDGVVRLHAVDLAGCAPLAELRGHRGLIADVAFERDGSTICTVDADGGRRRWQTEPALPRVWHPRRVPLAAVAARAGGGALVVGSDRLPVVLAAHGGPVQVPSVNGSAASVLDARGRALLQHEPEGGSLVWLATAERFDWRRRHAFAALAATAAGGHRIWTASGDEVLRWRLHDSALQRDAWRLRLDHPITALTVAHDGEHLACGCADGSVAVFAADGTRLSERALHRDHVWRLDFSGDGLRLASASRDETVWIGACDLRGGVRLTAHTGTVLAVKFAPAGDLLATASVDGTTRLWRADGEPFAVLRGHRGQIENLAFTASGDALWTAGSDGALRRWPLADAELLRLAGAARTSRDAALRYRELLEGR